MIPTVDLAAWRGGAAGIGPAVDEALQRAGFLLVTGHGVDAALRAEVRAAARAFFALPAEVKARYAVRIGGRGWLAPGVEANGNVEGTETPPDLKESFAVGPDTPTGDPEVDDVWFPPNVWPSEVPQLRHAVDRYAAAMTAVSRELLELCADALGLSRETLTSLACHPTWTFNINRYPPLTEVGPPAPGQFRIGSHTDFGTVTVLDREPGAGGLQVDIEGTGWVDAPYDPAALTVNIGDLLAHWTGLRWRSGRHRVLPPQPESPHEELVSLVFFFELDHDALVTPLTPPIGRRSDLEPVVSAPFLRERLDAISVG
ncbi:isopenicillin N synthase family dioxygenase [Pseudonocardia xinjiangensis]|uniref:isopenicillin N synthase family dioxygenase n=1 Tax=Pseudonocardia xinjiangensis TaxID=75289 RepID=UPI003D8A36CE